MSSILLLLSIPVLNSTLFFTSYVQLLLTQMINVAKYSARLYESVYILVCTYEVDNLVTECQRWPARWLTTPNASAANAIMSCQIGETIKKMVVKTKV